MINYDKYFSENKVDFQGMLSEVLQENTSKHKITIAADLIDRMSGTIFESGRPVTIKHGCAISSSQYLLVYVGEENSFSLPVLHPESISSKVYEVERVKLLKAGFDENLSLSVVCRDAFNAISDGDDLSIVIGSFLSGWVRETTTSNNNILRIAKERGDALALVVIEKGETFITIFLPVGRALLSGYHHRTTLNVGNGSVLSSEAQT